jgi:16S rRNA processing protein RimM
MNAVKPDVGARAQTVALSPDELVAVARVIRPRGVHGEITASVLTDYPERFDGLERLIALRPDGERKILEIESHWFHGERLILKFSGYDAPETAKELAGCELCVPESECIALADDEYYDWQLAGSTVETVAGAMIGKVKGVLRTGGTELLVIAATATAAQDILIPFAASICVEVDIEKRLIRIDPPEGLLEL